MSLSTLDRRVLDAFEAQDHASQMRERAQPGCGPSPMTLQTAQMGVEVLCALHWSRLTSIQVGPIERDAARHSVIVTFTDGIDPATPAAPSDRHQHAGAFSTTSMATRSQTSYNSSARRGARVDRTTRPASQPGK